MSVLKSNPPFPSTSTLEVFTMHPCSFVIEWLSALVVGSFFTWAAAEWRFVLSLCIIHIIILRLVFYVSLGLHTLKLLVCFLVVLLVQRGFNWIIHDHYTQATSSVESVFDVFTAKQWKGFNNNTAIMPQNLLKASVHLLGWSHGVTIWLCWGFWQKHNPEREYFVLSSDSASCFYWEQLKFDVFCFFCWLVYFLFILFKTTPAPFSSYCSNCTILDGKMISVETIWRSFENGVETAVNFAVDVVMAIRITQLLTTLSSLIRRPHLARHLLSQVHRKLCRYRFSPPFVLTLCGAQSTVKF